MPSCKKKKTLIKEPDIDACFKNFQLKRKRDCVSAEYLWCTIVAFIGMTIILLNSEIKNDTINHILYC